MDDFIIRSNILNVSFVWTFRFHFILRFTFVCAFQCVSFIKFIRYLYILQRNHHSCMSAVCCVQLRTANHKFFCENYHFALFSFSFFFCFWLFFFLLKIISEIECSAFNGKWRINYSWFIVALDLNCFVTLLDVMSLEWNDGAACVEYKYI